MLELNKIYNMDCLEGMKQLDDNSVQLVIIDPPYYKIKKDDWDTQWKTFKIYLDWIEHVCIEIKRVLKANGSFYIFADDERVSYIQIRLDAHFTFLNHLVWYKPNNLPLKYAHNHRKYAPMSERILFYSAQKCKTGLETIKLDIDNFTNLRKYFYDMLMWLGETNNNISKKLKHIKAEHSFYVLPKKHIINKIGQKGDHCFRYGSTQWDMPTNETYDELINIFKINKWNGFKEYEELRQEYEELRRPYNYQSGIHEIISQPIIQKNENTIHSTTKPVRLIKNFVQVSSNENDVVLDCFMGSGTTAVACKRLNRNFIGFEISKEYCDIANKRLNNVPKRLDNWF